MMMPVIRSYSKVQDVFFRTVFVFVIIELGSRRVVHLGVTKSPNDAWLAQQMREATPFGDGPPCWPKIHIRSKARRSE